jgi:hypothetical protein
MTRQRQHDVQQDEAQLVGAAPQVLDLLHQIKKREQDQQRGKHQRRRGDNLAREIAAQRSHRSSRKSENTITRR